MICPLCAADVARNSDGLHPTRFGAFACTEELEMPDLAGVGEAWWRRLLAKAELVLHGPAEDRDHHGEGLAALVRAAELARLPMGLPMREAYAGGAGSRATQARGRAIRPTHGQAPHPTNRRLR